MDIKNTIVVGYTSPTTVRLLPWRNSNGILIAGIPGFGKTYTASWLLAQYAYLGTSLVLADYGASQTTDQTLLDSLSFVSESFLLEPVTKASDIVETIRLIDRLGSLRYSGEIQPQDHYPIMFVIDEFPAFITNYKPPKTHTTKVRGEVKSEQGQTKTIQSEPTFLDSLLASILKLRKVNIHFMLIGQEWSQMGTVGIRAIRSNIGDKILHRLDKNGSALFGFDSKEERTIIQKLPVGYSYFNGDVLRTPRMTDSTMSLIQKRVDMYPKRFIPALYSVQNAVQDDLELSTLLQDDSYA